MEKSWDSRLMVFRRGGRVQAAIRAGVEAGVIKVRFSAEGCESREIVIDVK